ncbi:MAG: hypothetical protein MJ078_03965 [Clostridia bacterium]|nr:hypothetical protein [Clostridia bacterium]
MNIACGLTENGFSVQSDGRFNGTEAVCRPYPGFPTDLHPQLGALLCLSQTGGSIRDTVWKHRLKYTEELRKMGADLTAKAGKTVFFPSSFHGSVLRAVDLRAGAALAAAALAADGESVITEAENVQRGYENFAEKWRHLGGEVWEEP